MLEELKKQNPSLVFVCALMSFFYKRVEGVQSEQFVPTGYKTISVLLWIPDRRPL